MHVPKIVGWKKLKEKLKEKGYEEGCTLFEVPFDWRMDINKSWVKYLKPWIDEAKAKSGMNKVNIIAHSMGGLLVRAYIQSDPDPNRSKYKDGYENDIDKFAMVGTPMRDLQRLTISGKAAIQR